MVKKKIAMTLFPYYQLDMYVALNYILISDAVSFLLCKKQKTNKKQKQKNTLNLKM